jgi:DNA topoisomerase-1
MTADDLNAYLAEISGKPVTAKDFRTLYASAAALDYLVQLGPLEQPSARRRAIAEIARAVSVELANTPAVTRKSYIHQRIIDKFDACELPLVNNTRSRAGLSLEETKLMRFFESGDAGRAPSP